MLFKPKFLNRNILLPTGKYVICDPCLLAREDEWGGYVSILKAMCPDFSMHTVNGDVPVPGGWAPYIHVFTLQGDGRYSVHRSNVRVGSVTTDTGSFVVVPIEAIMAEEGLLDKVYELQQDDFAVIIDLASDALVGGKEEAAVYVGPTKRNPDIAHLRLGPFTVEA